MNLLKRLLSVFALLTVAACGGGGGDAGTSPIGGGGSGGGGGTPSTPVASDLVLTLSADSISNSGIETIVATAIALDANRNTVTGVPVTITVDNGGVATVSDDVTGAGGTITASIGIGADRTNRTITVRASSGSITKTVPLQVTDTGGSTLAASDLVLQINRSTIVNDGTETVVATATALDARRNALPGVGVTIEVNANATAVVSGPLSNAAGVVSAQIGIGGDNTLRTITVTARSGAITRTVPLQVTNVPTTTGPVARDITLALSSRTLDNGGTNTVRATVTAVDNNNNVLQGIPVTIAVDNTAIATVSGQVTDQFGRVTADVGIGSNRSNRTISIVATSGTLRKTASIQVVGAKLLASYDPRVNAGASKVVEYTLVDTNATPMTGEPIDITASTGSSLSGTTDANGKIGFTYRAPSGSNPPPVRITAVAAGAASDITIAVTGSVEPVDPDITITSASLTPTPTVVSVNEPGSENNQVEVRALFFGRNNATAQDNIPVPRVRARFSILNNADGSLGTIRTTEGDVAISDSNGVARATYIPGSRSSPTNGVTLQICWAESDAELAGGLCPHKVTAKLTVVQEALSVNIRTNELVKIGAAGLTYIKEYVVMVVDAAGQAKADVQITPSVDLTGFHKGFYYWNGEEWRQARTLANTERWRWTGAAWARVGGTTSQPVCPNEDINRNGVRDTNEDLNGNGDLDPRKADIAIKMVGSSKTDTNGIAVVQIEYGKNLATWVDYVITVTASGISGSEARARFAASLYGVGNLPAPGEDFQDEEVFPAFGVSPYGRGRFTALTNPGEDNPVAVPLATCEEED